MRIFCNEKPFLQRDIVCDVHYISFLWMPLIHGFGNWSYENPVKVIKISCLFVLITMSLNLHAKSIVKMTKIACKTFSNHLFLYVISVLWKKFFSLTEIGLYTQRNGVKVKEQIFLLGKHVSDALWLNSKILQSWVTCIRQKGMTHSAYINSKEKVIKPHFYGEKDYSYTILDTCWGLLGAK